MFFDLDQNQRRQIGDKNREAISRQYDMKHMIESYKISFGL